MKKYKCPWCEGTSCCITNIKKHIKELHEDRDHWTYWLYDWHSDNAIMLFHGERR